MKIILATGNKDKVNEIQQIVADFGWEVVSMKDAGVSCEIVEDGQTFKENATIKAQTVYDAYGQNDAIVMADDSGLIIDALNGEPGIYSARYMGEDTPYSIKNQNFIDRMKDVPDGRRDARFVCSIAAILPDGTVLNCEETFEGEIAHEIIGEHGFGFDPIFYVPEYKMTSAQMTEDMKNSMSHRGKAVRKMKQILQEYYGK